MITIKKYIELSEFEIIEIHKQISYEDKEIIENELYKVFSKYFNDKEG